MLTVQSDSDEEGGQRAGRKRKANGTRAAGTKRAKAPPKTVPVTEVEVAEGFKTDSPLFSKFCLRTMLIPRRPATN